MRTVSTTSPAAISQWKRLSRILSRPGAISSSSSSPSNRSLAQVRSEPFSELWFTATAPAQVPVSTKQHLENGSFVRSEGISSIGGNGSDHKSPDERTLRLGKTLRILSPLLPNILTTQLPTEIISPNISLHLFPSTHPHLPVVRGRIPYKAALWTAPVAWGCVPVVGNVKLQIVSEKMVRSGFITAPLQVQEECEELGEEKLVVRWKTEPKHDANGNGTQSSISASSAVDNGGVNRGLSTLLGGDKPLFGKDAGSESFSGLFVFSFDSEGRIANHTIEHADEASGFDKTNKVVTLADWLLGKARWRGLGAEDGVSIPGLAYKMRVCRNDIPKRERWQRRP